MSDYPTVRPRLVLDFANSKKLDRRITFRRSSTGTYVGADGLIKTANIDQPRFDHDPVTGICNGLLIEESRINGFTYSQDFTNAYWSSAIAVTITTSASIAPDGTNTANLIVPNEGTVNARIGKATVGTNGVNRVYSFFAKYAGIRYVAITTANTSGYGSVVDLLTGAYLQPVSGFVAAPTIVQYPNGWWRISHVTATGSTLAVLPSKTFTNKGIVGTDTFNGTDGLYLWGAQWEDNVTFPTSYIPTTGATVTRSADVASITGTNFSSWYNTNFGSFVVKGGPNQTTTTNSYLLNAHGTSYTADRNAIFKSSAANRLAVIVVTDGVTQVSQNIINTLLTPSSVSAYAYSLNDFYFTTQSLTSRSTSGTPSSLINALEIGRLDIANGGYINGTISRITYWPKRLPDSQLIALTRR